MLNPAFIPNSTDLQALILRHPLQAPASHTVMDAIMQMNGVLAHSQTPINRETLSSVLNPQTAIPLQDTSYPQDWQAQVRSSCVVIVQEQKVLGIFTQHDVIRLVAQQQPLHELTLGQVCQQPPITFQESALANLATVNDALQQHQISYLPIVNEQNQLTGLLTHEGLRQIAALGAQAHQLMQQYNSAQNQLQTELTARQQTVAHLRESEQRYTALVAASPVGILHTDAEGICIYANDRYGDMIGIEPAQLIGQPWHLGHHPSNLEDISQEYEQSLREHRPMRIEYRIQRRDGAEVWVYGQAVVVHDVDGQVMGYMGTVTDISDRKAAETALVEQKQQLSTLLSNLPGFVYRALNDADYTPVYISPGVTAITGYLPSEYLIDRTVSCGKLIHPEDVDQVWQSVQSALAAGQAYQCEYRIIDKFGQEKWLWERGRGTYDDLGTLLYLEGFITDVTDRKIAESLLASQQQILERIARAEPLPDIFTTLLKTMESYLPGAVCSITLCRDGRLCEVKAPSLPPDYATAINGLPIAEGVGSCGTAAFRRELIVVTDIDNDPLWQDYKSLVLNYGLQACSSVPIIGSDQTLLGVFGIYFRQKKAPQPQELDWIAQAANIAGIAIEREQTIQALKQLNQELESRVQARTQELQEREQFLQTVLDTFPLAVFWKNVDGVYLGCNQNFQRDAGLQTVDEIIGKTDYELPWRLTAADRYQAEDRLVIKTQTAKLGIVESQPQDNGQSIWLETNKLPLRNLQGEVIGVVGTYQDISHRKTIEAALAESEAKFRRLVEGGKDLIWSIDQQDQFTYLSPQFKALFGWEASEWIGKQSIEAVYPDDRNWLLQQRTLKAVNSAVSYLEFRHCHRDRSYIWVRSSSAPIFNSTGEVIGYQGTLTDITTLKQTEFALQESERRYASLAAAAPVAIFRFDRPLNCVYVNEHWSEMTGRPIESAMGHGWMEALHPDDREQLLVKWTQVYAQAGSDTLILRGDEGRHLKPDGTINWFYVQVAQELDDFGNIIGYVGTLTDITHRKVAEIALQESQAQFRRLAENIPGMIYRYGLLADGRDCFTYISPQIQELYEVEANLVIQDPEYLWSRIHPDDMRTLRRKIAESAQNLSPFVLEHRLLTSSGTKFAKAISQPQPHEDGSIFWDGVVIDLTDSKQIELQLTQSRQQYYSLIQSVNGIVWEYDLRTDCFTFVSQKAEEILGYPTTNWLNEPDFWRNHVYEADLAKVEQQFDQAIQAQKSCEMEYRMIAADGSLVWVYDISSPSLDENGVANRSSGVLIDIRDRKQTEQALKALSERLEIALEGANIGIWEWRAADNSLIWDARMLALYGLSASEFSGHYHDWLERIHPEDREYVQLMEQQSHQDQQAYEVEFRIVHPDGKLRFISSHALNQSNDQGEVIRAIGINIDITERKQAEQSLKVLSDRLELALSGAKIGIWEWNAIDDHLIWDDRMFDLYGVQPGDFSGRQSDWLQWIHPEDRETVYQQKQAALQNQQSYDYDIEFRITRPDGLIKFILARAAIQRNQQGEVQRVIGLNLDITDRKQVEQSLRESQHFIQKIADSSPNILFIYDIQEARNIYVNGAITPILGYTSEEIQQLGNKLFTSLMHPEDLLRLPDYIAKLYQAKDGEILEFEYRMRHANGEWRWLYSRDSIFSRDANGHLKQTIGTAEDITQRKQAEGQLQRTNEELIRATQLKDEFLANMSHELRTPLNAILGMAEALQDNLFGDINDRQMKSLKTIESSGKHLLELINDILDVAKIESGQITLDCQPTNVPQLCQSSLTFIKQQALKKSIQLHLHLPPYLPQLYVDERRIRQVLLNLLNNAVKFTLEQGQVTLAVNHSIASNTLRISVTDTGIGIAPGNIPKLFQPFIQVDSALNRQYSGTGLGLALVKRIVDLHGGTVELTSELGVGSCFTIHLPCVSSPAEMVSLEPSMMASESQISVRQVSSPLILLAEDHNANIKTVTAYLEAYGYRVLVAKNGQVAVEMAQLNHPDLILMDIQMPEVDGLQAIQAIRQDADLSGTPIIALTALVMAGDRERCLTAGANEYLSKPVNFKQLLATIQMLLD